MKKIRKIIKKLNNNGSSVVMVVVALAFIGIIVGALLGAAGYAYRLKIQQKNSKDNFYYVEQAMQEIYAGVGSQTADEMTDAYYYTIANMVTYNTETGTYQTIGDDEANKLFKREFMKRVKNNPYFSQGADELAASLENFISNKTVTLDKGKLSLEIKDNEIIIHDVTLNRTQEYGSGSTGGTYTQTISADIVIGEPDFDVNFNSHADNYSTIFDYALIGDMGIEIKQDSAHAVNIVGNIYAASDYYNKRYNSAEAGDGSDSAEGSFPTFSEKKSYVNPETGLSEDKEYSYKHGSVSSKVYTSELVHDLKNQFATGVDEKGNVVSLEFDGENANSMYSGLYIDGTTVSIIADKIIVPGSIAVMNMADLSVTNKQGLSAQRAEVWADNLILGGLSTTEKDGGASAYFFADLFIKDDTEINAENATLALTGGYYGYSNSTSADSRSYVQTVDTTNFMEPVRDEAGKIVLDEDGNVQYENRGHYNSSAIVVNGQNSTLDFSSTSELYLAGRAYIEMSKNVTTTEGTIGEGTEQKDTITETYTYAPTTGTNENTVYVRDFKTGESISLKSNQLAYIPVSKSGNPAVVTYETGGDTYMSVELPDNYKLGDDGFFQDFFPLQIFKTYVPCLSQTLNGKVYYFYDFETAYDLLKQKSAVNNAAGNVAKSVLENYPSLDEYTTAFIMRYTEEVLKGEDSQYYGSFDDISNYSEFDMENGGLIVPEADDNHLIYSSGAITTKNSTSFNMVTENDPAVINSLLSKADSATAAFVDNIAHDNSATAAFNYSKDLDREFTYLKWNLDHYDSANQEKAYINDLLASDLYGEDMLTPINKYCVFDNITMEVNPNNLTIGDYRVWVSENDVVVTAATGSSEVKGIVVTKGDVTFDENVTDFYGIIIAGGKIYVNQNVTHIQSNAKYCADILQTCQSMDETESQGKQAQMVAKVFREYGTIESGDEDDPSAKNINSLDYSDVVSMQNWMKTVE